MAPVTTRSGISVLDGAFGGFYLKRATLVSGRRKSGKSIVAWTFLTKTLLSGENVVVFTARPPTAVTSPLESKGIDSRQVIESGQLIICPYSTMKREGTGPFAPLPFPQASEELAKLVLDNSISYAIFDSVVPWTAIEPLEKMQDHAEDFVGSLDALKLTSLLILPNAASPAAQSLTNVLRELCPTNIELESKRFGAEFVLRVTKYQGATSIELPWEKTLNFIPGEGFVAPEDGGALLEAQLAARQPMPAERPSKSKSPKFRPLIQQGPADFAGRTPASAKKQEAKGAEGAKGRGTRFKALVSPSPNAFAASAGAPTTQPAPENGSGKARPAGEAGQKPGFASVIDIFK